MSHQRDVAQYVCESVVKVTAMPDATLRVLGYNTGTGAGEKDTMLCHIIGKNYVL